MFDVRKLSDSAFEAIQEFANSHQDETFYAFAIDDGLLCFNSEQAYSEFRSRLKNTVFHPKDRDFYESDEYQNSLRFETGDWKYQGFAEFSMEDGFDDSLRLEHIQSEPENYPNTDYAKSMNEVLANLQERRAFDSLKRTKDFLIILAEPE